MSRKFYGVHTNKRYAIGGGMGAQETRLVTVRSILRCDWMKCDLSLFLSLEMGAAANEQWAQATLRAPWMEASDRAERWMRACVSVCQYGAQSAFSVSAAYVTACFVLCVYHPPAIHTVARIIAYLRYLQERLCWLYS